MGAAARMAAAERNAESGSHHHVSGSCRGDPATQRRVVASHEIEQLGLEEIIGILRQQGLPAPGAETRHRFPHVFHGNRRPCFVYKFT
jgi:hypothetical protein